MKKIITLSLFIILTLLSEIKAQEIVIQGTISNSKKEKIPFANVILKSISDSSIVKAELSKIDGTFLIYTKDSAHYYLQISSVGYVTYQQKISPNVSPKLYEIILKEDTKLMDEVVVTAEKPIVQVLADKTVFNIENSLSATGTSGWELLRKAPGVIIDNSNAIILEGKAGVQLYIDGRLSPLQGNDLQAYLASLQATDIESIEIITQPSSKYDAAGGAGIINIKLKKNKSLGTNGSLNASITYGDYIRSNNSISFNKRTLKQNLYGSYGNSMGKSTGFINLIRQQNGRIFEAKTQSIYDPENHNLKLGYDFFLNRKSTLGLIFNGNVNSSTSRSNSRTPIRPVNNEELDSILIAKNRNEGSSQNYNINLNYQFADTLGQKLTIDLDYGYFNREEEVYQPNFYYNGEETDLLSSNITYQELPITIHILATKADYENNLFQGKLATGIKFSLVKTANIFNFYNQQQEELIKNIAQSNEFNYLEIINAAYINYNKKMARWTMQLGLRAEQTISDGNLQSEQINNNNRVKRNYLNWFPSGGFTYQPNSKNQFALTYSKRVNRPNYSSLNPFEYKIDELSFMRGNPFLQPQYIDNLKLSHTYSYRLTTSFSYSYISDFFAQITEAEGENKNFISQRNIANQEIYNIGISYPFSIKKWWNVYFSLNAYQSSYRALNLDFVALTRETLSFYMQNTFNLPAQIQMELSGWFSSPSVWGGTYETDALGALNLAFQKKFFSEKLNLRLAFNDVLYSIPWSGTTQFGNLFINGSGGSDSRNIAFSLNYNFGNSEVKKARNREAANTSEVERIN